MKKNTLPVLIIIGFILLIVTPVMINYAISHKPPDNPPETVGNTAGNINNGGYFCERDGIVYFANWVDEGSLYCMTVDEQSIRQLSSSRVTNLLADENYLYYFHLGVTSSSQGLGTLRQPHNFFRSDHNGGSVTVLTGDTVISGQLVGNYLYLLTSASGGISFYKMRIDKEDQTQLASYIINPACAEDGIIYYNGTQTNHYLYALHTDTDVSERLWAGNIWYPSVYGNYVYYLDVANDYRLCRYDRVNDVIEIITEDRVDCYNFGGGYIYYQRSSQSEPALMMMRMDGSDVQKVADGNFTHISMTSGYVYFQEYGAETSMYHAPIGSAGYSAFIPVASD